MAPSHHAARPAPHPARAVTTPCGRGGLGWGVQRWWLLTTTAEVFFKKRGFVVTPRGGVPTAIAATAEFRGLCPSVAVCLSRERRSA